MWKYSIETVSCLIDLLDGTLWRRNKFWSEYCSLQHHCNVVCTMPCMLQVLSDSQTAAEGSSAVSSAVFLLKPLQPTPCCIVLPHMSSIEGCRCFFPTSYPPWLPCQPYSKLNPAAAACTTWLELLLQSKTLLDLLLHLPSVLHPPSSSEPSMRTPTWVEPDPSALHWIQVLLNLVVCFYWRPAKNVVH